MTLIKEGKNLEYEKPCVCKNPSWYYLYESNYGPSYTSPLFCGDCCKPVLLYKVPYIHNEEEHYSILNWQKGYFNMDGLWAHGLWDRFTYGETQLKVEP